MYLYICEYNNTTNKIKIKNCAPIGCAYAQHILSLYIVLYIYILLLLLLKNINQCATARCIPRDPGRVVIHIYIYIFINIIYT